MKLYGFGPTRSLRAIWALQELDAEFEFIPIDLRAGEHKREDYLRINPAGKVPALVDGDVVLSESVAIVLYLAEKYRDKGLLPNDLAECAQVYRWLLFAATELEQPLWRIAKHTALLPEEKRLAQDVPQARQDFLGMAAVLEKHMQGREFVVGSRVSVADLVMAYTLDWGNEAKLLGDFPALRAYLERMYRRPKAAPRIAAAFAGIQAGAPT